MHAVPRLLLSTNCVSIEGANKIKQQTFQHVCISMYCFSSCLYLTKDMPYIKRDSICGSLNVEPGFWSSLAKITYQNKCTHTHTLLCDPHLKLSQMGISFLCKLRIEFNISSPAYYIIIMWIR